MDEWSAWQRWGVWLLGWALYVGAFWLLLAGAGLATRIVALAGICAGLLVLTYSSKAVLNERMRKIDHWQLRTILPAFLVYMLLVLYVMPLEAGIATPWLKALVVLSPMLPVLFIAWAVVRYVNRCDEMERRQHLEAAGVAVVVVSVACMTLGLLSAAKLITVNGALVLLLMLPALCVVYGFACTWSKWRNRAR
ncbi:MAG: hypothetical protein JSR56_14830 [Proteobacteria bacterium]|nr:hypothetical protein [Pseudomonadota bacterium]